LVAAALEARADVSRRPWRAEVLRRDFRERFTKRGYLFSEKDAQIFQQLLDERLAADYDVRPFTQRRAERDWRAAEDLCSRLRMVIDNV
jgi:hypothetical protein